MTYRGMKIRPLLRYSIIVTASLCIRAAHFRQSAKSSNGTSAYVHTCMHTYIHKHIAQSVQRWAMDWTIGVLGFDSRRGLGFFLFTTASRTALGPTQPPNQWVPGASSLRLKRPVCEADHSLPYSAELKNAWSYTSTPQYVFMAWCLVKHRDNFTSTIYIYTHTHI
jgi:hypothetical protein